MFTTIIIAPWIPLFFILLYFIFSNSVKILLLGPFPNLLKALLLGPHLSVCLMKYLFFLSMLQNNNSILRHEMDLDPWHFPWDSLSWEEESFFISREKRHEHQKRDFYRNSWCLSAVIVLDGAGVPQGLQQALPVVVSVEENIPPKWKSACIWCISRRLPHILAQFRAYGSSLVERERFLPKCFMTYLPSWFGATIFTFLGMSFFQCVCILCTGIQLGWINLHYF